MERYLGGGADTEVWRADGDGIVVALKLRRRGIDDPLATARLAREATVLRSVRHPALVGLFDSGEDDGEPYLAFVFHDGPTLAEHLDDGRLPAEVAAATFAPVADALAALHAASVVHRDIKPSNVLLSDIGPLLIDAGHASIRGTTYDGWVDDAPALAGTTAYLAPEAADELPSPALDVYALGVSVIEAVTGTPRSDAVVAVPEPLRALVRACVDDDPAVRPAATLVATTLRVIAADASPAVGRFRPALIDLTRPDEPLDARDAEAANAERSGRAAELGTLLAAAYDGALADELRPVLVSAPPGTGKSWLVDAAAARVDHRGGKVVRAACTPARGDVRVVADWLLDLGRDTAGATELAAVAGPAPAAMLLRAVGLGRAGEGDVDPACVADAMATVLAHAAPEIDDDGRRAPLVCVVEDLHHASLELLDLLSRLALRAGVPGALWCTTRPNWIDADDLEFELLPLGPLTPEAIAELVGDVGATGGRPIEEIVAVAGGNPLHAREAALALQRGESLTASTSLPDLIAARFASYEPTLRDALGLAAACGDQFWPEALGREFLDAVPDLYRAGVAQARMCSTLSTSTEAQFRHPLLREVAYASLDEARRRQLHARLGRVLDAADAPPEVVAEQAGTAFRLGDTAAAPLAARSAADAGRDALDRFSLQAAEEWIALLRDTHAESQPGLADLLDTELALDRGEYERARELVGADPEQGSLAASRLALATRAAYGVGELGDAERFGARALDLLDDASVDAGAHTVMYATVLSRTGHYEAALALLDGAALHADAAGLPGLHTRLSAKAAQVASDLARARGGYFTDAIDRTRRAIEEQRQAGDVRAYVASAPAFIETLYIDFPQEALHLAIDAAERARTMGDVTSFGALALSVCDVALESEAAPQLEEWLPILQTAPLDATGRIEADLLTTVAEAACSPRATPIAAGLLLLADRSRALGDVSRIEPEMGAVCSLAWTGRAHAARELLSEKVRDRLPPQIAASYELVVRALEGPPWTLDGVDALDLTTLHHYDRALLHLLRDEGDAADALLRERYEDRKRTSGSTRQRFSPYFPGALVSALGPSDTEPDVEWLLGWIHEPPFPGLWVVHRAICALLLSERADTPEPGLAATARRIVDMTDADESVRAWISERSRRSGA
ncbi:MAG TPA: protein kinase [Acidimicrobiia bacterium]|nr:protein kinase [Acidimicrobiia bacterium]